ncbi:hypothetical protein WR25_19504 [Diploscapter pachys]|uniref:DUF19 domain-containing protein n=1 Tax=Diploscapter pachys TaxID=2018661 RepID=A0A2A2K0K5_9BILA|nr:hypothetical protein WR25_19504 [Diploscapter pachys]
MTMMRSLGFNKQLNITNMTDWTDITGLINGLNGFYLSGVNGFLQVCRARHDFAQCLGEQYSTCMSPQNFIKSGLTPINATTYCQIFIEMEFDCNGGLIQSTRHYDCILDVLKNQQGAFNVGWFECERLRLAMAFDKFCPNIQCGVAKVVSAPKRTPYMDNVQMMMEAKNGMVKSIFFVLALFALSHAQLLPDYQLSNDEILFVANAEQPKERAISQCIDVQWNYCQAEFNRFFGLTDDITWRNGTVIWNTVQKFLQMNVSEIIKVCNTRTEYYRCLGTSYYPCMDLYVLLNKPNADFQQKVVRQWTCLLGIQTTQAYQDCMTTFNNTVAAKNFCPAVQENGRCLNNVYSERCADLGAGYYGCESFRITFDNACWDTRCVVAWQR